MRSRLLRPVDLPEGLEGRLFLAAMPGRVAPFETFVADATAAGVTLVASFAEPHEITARAPEYAAARAAGTFPFAMEDHPIPDYGTPQDVAAFDACVGRVAASLRRGGRVVLHCGAGIGRTGLAARSVLEKLGTDRATAAARVHAAGSHAESASQRAFLARLPIGSDQPDRPEIAPALDASASSSARSDPDRADRARGDGDA